MSLRVGGCRVRCPVTVDPDRVSADMVPLRFRCAMAHDHLPLAIGDSHFGVLVAAHCSHGLWFWACESWGKLHRLPKTVKSRPSHPQFWADKMGAGVYTVSMQKQEKNSRRLLAVLAAIMIFSMVVTMAASIFSF